MARRADLAVLDYGSPTPLTAENFAWHLAFGMTAASVESVMVNGKFVIRDRRFPFDDQDIYRQARAACERVWSKLRTA